MDEEIVCEDLSLAIGDLRAAGFRIDLIYPAEEPHTAVLSKGTSCVRVTSRPGAGQPSASLPQFEPRFLLTRAGGKGGEGRAGMQYRDLIPGRLGGRYIASHISIPEGGAIEDWVHFHRIALQIIYVRRGWVRVVYEDAGEPFVMGEGDLVLQPPEIRHRVLESSSGLEVVEITAPALHATFADHLLDLPNDVNSARVFEGQKFLHHLSSAVSWTEYGCGEAQETAVSEASGGVADVRTVRSGRTSILDFPPHEGELVFGFVLTGSAVLECSQGAKIDAGDAFVVPPGEAWRLGELSRDFRMLHITTASLD